MAVRAKRSLTASPEGLDRANKAVLKFATKLGLAVELNVSRATVQNFFAGKAIGRENFHNICQKLELPWEEIARLNKDTDVKPQERRTDNGCEDVDALVKELRQKGSACIQQKCGMMRVLDMSQPIDLSALYTNVNVFEKISGRRRLEVTDFVKVYASGEFERQSSDKIIQERVLGLEAIKKYSKLMVLGKPGVGKTTFLKYIAIQCSLGESQADLVPIFVVLKDFAETQHSSLLKYLTEEFATYGVSDTTSLQQVLGQGKALVLLDGLDEVRETDEYRIVQEIRNFSSKFHANHFVLTCRIATREYTFEQFTDVEIADFDNSQITTFINKWSAAKAPIKHEKLIQKLRKNPRIQELATNPLLLTLLCLMFEECGDFPLNRSELYEEGLNVLLKKWDAKRNIAREQVYKNLCIQHKVDLLSQIAFKTFERGDYFFRQRELEQHTADYICNLPGVSTELEALQLDSEAVLKSIEAQHGLLVERARGIYSFSHLTFHEYFTAKEIVSSPDPQSIATALKQLVSHIAQKRWREVFLLSAGMLRNADYLLQLMKQQIDQLLFADEQLQAFLTWVSKKSRAVNTAYKLVIVRAFYFDLDLARILGLVGSTLELSRGFDRSLTCNLDSNLAIDLALNSNLALNRVLKRTTNHISVLNSLITRAINHAHLIDLELEQLLQQLKKQIPDPDTNLKEFELCWDNSNWIDQLKTIMISKRNFGHDWQFSSQQKEALKQYYEANMLLVECLNSNCYVTSRVRQEIEETLLLPLTEL